jgi:hypothetical protein
MDPQEKMECVIPVFWGEVGTEKHRPDCVCYSLVWAFSGGILVRCTCASGLSDTPVTDQQSIDGGIHTLAVIGLGIREVMGKYGQSSPSEAIRRKCCPGQDPNRQSTV